VNHKISRRDHVVDIDMVGGIIL